jgi:hypothetical protein
MEIKLWDRFLGVNVDEKGYFFQQQPSCFVRKPPRKAEIFKLPKDQQAGMLEYYCDENAIATGGYGDL